jgi:3',5'-cyclic-AMP phosphodiesterase
MTDPILTFVHISDTHIPVDPDDSTRDGVREAYTGAQALVDQLHTLPFTPDFVLHTGDVTYRRDAAAYDVAKTILDAIEVPVYYVAGNCDIAEDLQRVLMGRETPITPYLHYEAEVKGVQIAVIDTNGPAPFPAGFVTEDQLAWLGGLCTAKDDRPLIIAMHHNPIMGGVPWLDDVAGIKNSDALHAAILPAKDRLRGVFFGHIHQNIDIYRDGILYCSTLSSWTQFQGWPGQAELLYAPDEGPGFSVVTIYPGQTVMRRHRFSAPL